MSAPSTRNGAGDPAGRSVGFRTGRDQAAAGVAPGVTTPGWLISMSMAMPRSYRSPPPSERQLPVVTSRPTSRLRSMRPSPAAGGGTYSTAAIDLDDPSKGCLLRSLPEGYDYVSANGTSYSMTAN